MFVAQVQNAVKLARIRIEQQFVVVEAVAELGLIRSGNAVAVQRARPQARNVAMPDLIGVFRQRQAFDFALSRRIEQTHFDFFSVFGKEGEIDPLAVPCRTERIRFAWPYTSA